MSLPKFISPNQSAFVKNRLLMENVLLASELVKSYYKSSVSARCTLKIDPVDAVVYLVDTYKERFAKSKKELDALFSGESLANVPLLVLGN